MKASEVSFETMRKVAPCNQTLSIATSYMQVEYGLSELEACWDGFVHTSDHHEIEFKSRKQICEEFASALNEYIEYLGESAFIQMGS
jgi:hypothetical protein